MLLVRQLTLIPGHITPEPRRRRRRRDGLSAQLRRRDAWARVRKVMMVVVFGSGIIFVSSYLAEKSSGADLRGLVPPSGLPGGLGSR